MDRPRASSIVYPPSRASVASAPMRATDRTPAASGSVRRSFRSSTSDARADSRARARVAGLAASAAALSGGA